MNNRTIVHLDEFEGMALSEQVQILSKLNPKERKELIFLSESTEELVQSLCENEVLEVASEAVDHELVTLVECLESRQLQFLLDLETWKLGNLDKQKVMEWMEILMQCAPEKSDAYLGKIDPETFAAWILSCGAKYTGECAELFHPEDIACEDAHGEDFLHYLYLCDESLFNEVCRCLAFVSPTDIAAHTHKQQKARMSTMGLPCIDEAREIYAHHGVEIPQECDEPAKGIQTRDKDRHFMEKVLEHEGQEALSREESDRLEEEMRQLLLHVVVADGVDPRLDDLGPLRDKCTYLCSLGIELGSYGNIERACVMLRDMEIADVFRIGHARFYKFREAIHDKQENLVPGSQADLYYQSRLELASKTPPQGYDSDGETIKLINLQGLRRLEAELAAF